jgi:hypothetical protein
VPKKLNTLDFIAAARAKHGGRYDYTRVAYENRQTPVTIVCSKHGAFTQMPADHIHSGAGCPTCSGNTKLTLERFVSECTELHAGRYDYSKVVVVNNTTEVEIVCSVHGSFWQQPKLHRKGRGCPKCAGVAKKDTAEFIRIATLAHGNRYDYSKTNYVGARDKVTIICRVHGAFEQIASVHYKGGNCPVCSKSVAPRKAAAERFERAQAGILARGLPYAYEFPSDANEHSYIAIVCDKGHKFTQRADGAKRYGCPTCAGRNSAGEAEVRAFVESLGVTTVRTRKVIPPTELDIWCPEQKVGFEYNGLYWHSDARSPDRNRHKDKSDAVRAAGGELVHIWSDDWALRRTAVEHMIRAKLGRLPSVGARTCEVRPVPADTARSFLETYHLQGWASADYIGLWRGGELLACMGFAVARSIRGNTDPSVFELVRYAAKVRVAGGGSRLLAAWKAKGLDWTRLVTYCDLAQFTGGLYVGMGFKETARYGADYKILRAGYDRRLHKSAVQKTKLKTLLGDKFDPSKTEAQLCAENHIFRVWDCGRVRYELAHTV